MPRKTSKAKAPPSSSAKVDKDAVTRLAYELYVRRGGAHGHDVEDWLLAEQILLERSTHAGGRPSAPKKARRLEDKFSK